MKYNLAYQLLGIPHKPINDWFYIEVMIIMTKKCTTHAVAIYTYLQVAYFSLWIYIQNPRSHTPWIFTAA